MATIWGNPFTISDLKLPLPPLVQTGGMVDEWGLPLSALDDGFMFVKAKLKPSKKLTKDIEISLALQKNSVLFEGYVVSITPAEGILVPDTKGTGVINGQVGEIRLISTGQSSLEIIQKILGEKISLEFTRTTAHI